MNCKKCEVCSATWVDGQLYWSGTQKQGRNLDLASLCCNRLAALDPTKFELCANPCKGQEGGDTWEERMKFLIGEEETRKRRME
jgi:hypothetical protein